MIEVRRDLTIILSRGDILDVIFNIQGMTLDANAQVILSIKNRVDDTDHILLKQCSRIDNNQSAVRILIESEETAKIPAGRYYYDLVYKSGDNAITLNYPSRLLVREVVHDL